MRERKSSPAGVGKAWKGRDLPDDGLEMLFSIYREERLFLLRIIRNSPYTLEGMEEDLLHGAVERMLSRAESSGPRWEDRAHCRNSLLATARNLAIDHHRKEARRKRLYLHEAELHSHGADAEAGADGSLAYEVLADAAGMNEGPEECCLREEEHACARSLLASLEEDEMRLFVMREEQRLAWSEIAGLMGQSEVSLRMRYSRLKARLRRACRKKVGL